MYRDNTKVIKIGNRVIGGGNPVLIQSMTNTPTEDVKSTVDQILRLEKAGCEIIRCTVPDEAAAKALKKIKKEIIVDEVNDDSLGAEFFDIYKLSKKELSAIDIMELEKLGYKLN